jgi:hypothetical protein
MFINMFIIQDVQAKVKKETPDKEAGMADRSGASVGD